MGKAVEDQTVIAVAEFNPEWGIKAKAKQARKRFDGKVFDLPNGVHAFTISWASENNEDYPCFGIKFPDFLPVTMLASDYETASQASPEAVQAKAWVGNETIHPNYTEILINVVKNRPKNLLLKS